MKKNENINLLMKDAREKLGMTQQQLADMIGVSKPYINKIEKKVTKKPSFAVLSQLASILKIDYVDLIEEYDYDIENILNNQYIIKFFKEHGLDDESKNKYIYSNKKYSSEDIIKDFTKGNISKLDAIYLFINLLEEIEEKQSS